VYETATQKMPHTTVVSIAHRNTVEKYHQEIKFFNPCVSSTPSLGKHSPSSMAP
jgi:ABC-type uncharacterized transport system fused permease/ATPase subunit